MVKLVMSFGDINHDIQLVDYAPSMDIRECGEALDNLWEFAKKFFIGILQEQVESGMGVEEIEESKDILALYSVAEKMTPCFICHAVSDLIFSGSCYIKTHYEQFVHMDDFFPKSQSKSILYFITGNFSSIFRILISIVIGWKVI